MNKYELRIIAATGILLMSFLFAVLYAAYAKRLTYRRAFRTMQRLKSLA